jgi:hypothetical protein
VLELTVSGLGQDAFRLASELIRRRGAKITIACTMAIDDFLVVGDRHSLRSDGFSPKKAEANRSQEVLDSS